MSSASLSLSVRIWNVCSPSGNSPARSTMAPSTLAPMAACASRLPMLSATWRAVAPGATCLTAPSGSLRVIMRRNPVVETNPGDDSCDPFAPSPDHPVMVPAGHEMFSPGSQNRGYGSPRTFALPLAPIPQRADIGDSGAGELQLAPIRAVGIHDLDTKVRIVGRSEDPLAVLVHLPVEQRHCKLLAVRRPEDPVGRSKIDLFNHFARILAVHIHRPDAVAVLGRLAQIGDFLAVGREARMAIEPALRQPALLGAVGLHDIELVPSPMGLVPVGTGHEPLPIGRPVVDRVGVGNRQLDGIPAISVDFPGFILPSRIGAFLVLFLGQQLLLGRHEVLAVRRPDGPAAFVGDLARVVASLGVAVPDAG